MSPAPLVVNVLLKKLLLLPATSAMEDTTTCIVTFAGRGVLGVKVTLDPLDEYVPAISAPDDWTRTWKVLLETLVGSIVSLKLITILVFTGTSVAPLAGVLEGYKRTVDVSG